MDHHQHHADDYAKRTLRQMEAIASSLEGMHRELRGMQVMAKALIRIAAALETDPPPKRIPFRQVVRFGVPTQES
jgi:hypothetical protein